MAAHLSGKVAYLSRGRRPRKRPPRCTRRPSVRLERLRSRSWRWRWAPYPRRKCHRVENRTRCLRSSMRIHHAWLFLIFYSIATWKRRWTTDPGECGAWGSWRATTPPLRCSCNRRLSSHSASWMSLHIEKFHLLPVGNWFLGCFVHRLRWENGDSRERIIDCLSKVAKMADNKSQICLGSHNKDLFRWSTEEKECRIERLVW